MSRADDPSRHPPLQVSVISPVLNERRHLPALVESIERQTLPPVEAIFCDGGSDDGTREWLGTANRSRPWIRLLHNPDRIVTAGLNRTIGASSGDVVARMDGHAWYPPDYLERLVGVLDAHPEVVGAGAVMRMRGEGPWGKAIAAVLDHPIGLGGAPHRAGGRQGPTYHVGHGAYRRAALMAVGGFDPSFEANEDFELDQRLRRAGGVVWLEPSTSFTSFARETPRALAAQMWRYGYYKARTLWKHPGSLRLRHLAPPGLILGVAGLTALSPRWAGSVVVAYLSSVATAGSLVARAHGASPWRGGLLVPLVHLAWGGGLLAGLVSHRAARRERAGVVDSPQTRASTDFTWRPPPQRPLPASIPVVVPTPFPRGGER